MKPQGVVWTGTSLAVVLILAGCRKTEPDQPRPQAVKVAAARETDGSRDLRLSGTIEAERSTNLSFLVPGTIEVVLVEEGEVVRRGQPLARLTVATFEDALGIARSTLAQADDARRRLEPMHRNHTVPEVKWVDAYTSVEKARHSLSMAQKNLDDTVLRAAEAGIVARRHVEPGTTAVPGAPVITLVQTRIVLATAPVPETQVATVLHGAAARVTVAALGKTFAGRVRDVGVLADPLTRTYTVKVALSNEEGLLRVGMVAEVFLHQAGATTTVVVPPEAVRLDETGRTCVWVVEPNDRLRRQTVVVSGFLGEGTALSEGVRAGDRLVTSGSPMLADGVTVSVVADTSIPAAAANAHTARH